MSRRNLNTNTNAPNAKVPRRDNTPTPENLAQHFVEEFVELLEPAALAAWPELATADEEKIVTFSRHGGYLLKMTVSKVVEILHHINNYAARFDPLTFFQLDLQFVPDTNYPPGEASVLHIRHRNPNNNKYSLSIYPGYLFQEAWTTFDDYVERQKNRPQVTTFYSDGTEKRIFSNNKSSQDEPIFNYTVHTYTTKQKRIQTNFDEADNPLTEDRFQKESGKLLTRKDFVAQETIFYNDTGAAISATVALTLARKERRESPDAEVRKMAQEIITQAQEVQAANVQRIFEQVVLRETTGNVVAAAAANVNVELIKKTIANVIKMNVPQLMQHFTTMKRLPAVDPFEFVEAEYLAQNPFVRHPRDLETIKQISQILVFGTLKAILGAIKLCLDHYKSHKRITFLLWASALVGLYQNEMIHYCGVSIMLYPSWYSKPQEDRPRILGNFTKNKYQWVFFDMVSRTFKYMSSFEQCETEMCKQFNANQVIKYSQNSFNAFDMCYSQDGRPTANCALASLLEASYFQAFKGQAPADIYIGLQHEPSAPTRALEPQRKSLDSIVNSNNSSTHYPLKGKQVTHFFTPKIKLNATTKLTTGKTALRYVQKLEMCGPRTLNYEENSAYIAQTLLYTEIHFFKASTLITTYIYANDEQMYMMSHLHGLLFFWLRKLLEDDKTDAVIHRDYAENVERNNVLYKMTLPPAQVQQLLKIFFTSLALAF